MATTAATAEAPTKVYPISPIRWWVIFSLWWLSTLILLLPAIVTAITSPGRGFWGFTAVCAAISGLILTLIMLQLRTTRLEIRPHGVLIRQFRTQVETTWDNVEAIRLTRFGEGLVLRQPMDSYGAAKLARFCHVGLYGQSLYDYEKACLLEEHRFMPMDVFAYWIKHGDLWAELVRHAPNLADAQGKPAHQEPVIRDTRKVNAAALTILIMTIVIVLTFLVILPARQAAYIWAAIDTALGAGMVLTAFGSLRSGIAHLRKRHVFEGLFWLWLSLMQVLMALLFVTGVYREGKAP